MNRQSFAQRSTSLELMDTESFSFDEFHHYLDELERINFWTLAYRPTLRWLRQAIAALPQQPSISILDVGSGNGDMLRKIGNWTRIKGLNVRLIGVDLNPWSKKSAILAAHNENPIQFETTNIFDLPPEYCVDFIISSLFTHHLTDEENIRFLGWMEEHARHGWFINDLHRHPIPYYFIKYAARLFCRVLAVRHDGPLSVARAFTAAHWRHLLHKAGITAARVNWVFPFRYCVARNKP